MKPHNSWQTLTLSLCVAGYLLACHAHDKKREKPTPLSIAVCDETFDGRVLRQQSLEIQKKFFLSHDQKRRKVNALEACRLQRLRAFLSGAFWAAERVYYVESHPFAPLAGSSLKIKGGARDILEVYVDDVYYGTFFEPFRIWQGTLEFLGFEKIILIAPKKQREIILDPALFDDDRRHFVLTQIQRERLDVPLWPMWY